MSLLGAIKYFIEQLLNGQKDSAVNKFGFNNDVDTTGSEDIWSVGGLYPYSTFSTTQSLEVVSTSGLDVAASTGAYEITISGLDENLAVKNETVQLNGLTAVPLAGTWLAINRAFITEPTGSTGVNQGDFVLGKKVPACVDHGRPEQCCHGEDARFEFLQIGYGTGGVVAVVLEDDFDLSAMYPPLGVDVVSPCLAPEPRHAPEGSGPGKRGGPSDHDLRIRDTGNIFCIR